MKIVLALLVLLTLSFKALGFDFGVANAPGQVEDELSDTWLEWAHAGNIQGWQQNANPEKRLQFWTHPEVELDLAKKLGVQSFRMGIDWARVMPERDQYDEAAIKRYHEIFKMAYDRDLKLMVTLMHHSVPAWVQKNGGWHNKQTKEDFITFSKKMIYEFDHDVEWWITFNEPQVFVINAYTIGIWPPGEKRSPLALAALGPFTGSSIDAMDLMAEAHNEIYEWAHKNLRNVHLGIANNMAHYSGKNLFDKITAFFADRIMNWRFPEKIRQHMDFFGVNYYGAEWLKSGKIDIDPEEEYSDAGRAIDVNGLYDLLVKIHDRYPYMSIKITENGIADSSDAIRGSYMVEHLAAVAKAIEDHVPVSAYYVWSLTDNLEWSDGYCPKFGLVAVDRKNFKRTPRPSFELLQKIISQKGVTEDLRQSEWNKVLAVQGKERDFCRDEDGVTAYDVAHKRNFTHKDWRLNK
jgi:galactolipid galactosyltransferase